MANEISFSASLSSTKTGLTVAGSGSLNATQTAAAMLAAVQTVGTSSEAISLGDITDLGYLFVKNQDLTNFVYLSLVSPPTASNSFCKLLPGEFVMVPCKQELVYGLADTTACDCQVVAVST